MKFVIEHNTPAVRAALKRAPRVMQEHVDPAVGRGALELTRAMRDRAPKALSELTNAILPRRLKLADWLVEVRKRYARYVEEGTRGGGWPPRPTILEWMRARGIEARDGDQDSLAFLIQRAIHRRGTPAQPYAGPSLKALESRLRELIRRGYESGLDAVARLP